MLALAHFFPYLRYKKPQPYRLSRALDFKIKQRQRWTELLREGEEGRWFAEREDQWDDLVGGWDDDGDGEGEGENGGEGGEGGEWGETRVVKGEGGAGRGSLGGDFFVDVYDAERKRLVRNVRWRTKEAALLQKTLAEIVVKERALMLEERAAGRIKRRQERGEAEMLEKTGLQ